MNVRASIQTDLIYYDNNYMHLYTVTFVQFQEPERKPQNEK